LIADAQDNTIHRMSPWVAPRYTSMFRDCLVCSFLYLSIKTSRMLPLISPGLLSIFLGMSLLNGMLPLNMIACPWTSDHSENVNFPKALSWERSSS
jgi:hypothetical protein